MNNSSSNNIWARLIALNPDKEDIHLLSQQPEEPEEYKPNTGWKISQKSTGDTWITNYSGPSIKVNDNWLEVDGEVEIFSGQRISFNKEKESQDENFDYVFFQMNSQTENANKRPREESLEPEVIFSSPKTAKLAKISNDLEQGLTCSICMKIFHKCIALNPCLHPFCSWCILNSLKSSVQCPLCKVKAISIIKNFVLQNLVELTLKIFPEKERSKEDIEQKHNELEGKIVKTDDWTYIGAYENEKIQGKGNMIYSHGNIFEGTWKDGKREGRGSLTFRSGTICKGQWLNDVAQKIDEVILPNKGVYKGETKGFQAHGKGVLKYYNGDIYDGTFAENRMEGFGKYIFINGAEYQGEWKRGSRHGIGTMKYADGDIYKGEWKNHWKDGEGVAIFEDGSRYEGFWVRDFFSGKGKYIWSDGDEYEGNWIKGKKKGYGKIKHSDGRIYEGEWKDDNKEGNGVLTLANGDKYHGIWEKNVLQFVSQVYYTNGDIYEGGINLENFQRQGEGVLTFKNGDKYEGNWFNDKQYGKGRKICKRIFEGDWREGNMVGDVIMVDTDGIRYKVEWKKLEDQEKEENKE